MNSEQANYELIDRYHNKELSSEELKDFENKLQVDKEFSQENEMYIISRRSMRVVGRKELKDKMRSFEKEIQEKSSGSSRPSYYRYFAVAASIAVLIGAYWIFDSSMNDQDLYTANFEVYDSPTYVRGTGTLSNWQLGIEAYNERRFLKAYDHFENANGQASYLKDFYQAQCLASMDPPLIKEALEKCELVLNNNNTYVEQAKWYKGLFHIKLGEKESARTTFQEIVNQDGYNSKKASKILNSLD
ncbi:MAG: hypothetical protein HKN39_08400 [Flavobacteriales bacterium]|nr:hypothetical protein [Flavobacteriales bacterium]